LAKKPPPLDDEIRALYHGPLGEFIAGRQALSKRLRQAGDPRHGEVAELRKPPVSASAVNQLFAREARAVAALVGAGERARAAQRRGKGADAAALAELVATIRAETERLTGRGVEILAETSRAPGEAIVERLRTSLQALGLDPATAAVAERRWLDEDLPPPGFELLAALQVAAAPARPAPRAKVAAAPAPPPARKPGKATVHRLDEARSAAAEREKREDRKRRERVERAREELAAAEADAAAARRAAERAAGEAERAERDAAEADRRAEVARATARAARRGAEEAGERAAAAEAKAARVRESLSQAERS
jgi:hypothetical protein